MTQEQGMGTPEEQQAKWKIAYNIAKEEMGRLFPNVLTVEGELGEIDSFILKNISLVYNSPEVTFQPECEVPNVITAIINFCAENIPQEHAEKVELRLPQDGKVTEELYRAIISAKAMAIQQAKDRLPIVTLSQILRYHPGFDFDIAEFLGIRIKIAELMEWSVLQESIADDELVFRIECRFGKFSYRAGLYTLDSVFFHGDKTLRGNHLYALFGTVDRPDYGNLMRPKEIYDELIASLARDEECQVANVFKLGWLLNALRYKFFVVLEGKIRDYVEAYKAKHGMTPQEAWRKQKEAEPSLGKAIKELSGATKSMGEEYHKSGALLDELTEFLVGEIVTFHKKVFEDRTTLADTEKLNRELGKFAAYLDLFQRFLLDWCVQDEGSREQYREEIKGLQQELSRAFGFANSDGLDRLFEEIEQFLKRSIEGQEED